MSLFGLFRKKPRRPDDDPRVAVTKGISPDDFVRVNDQTYEYRKKVHPKSLTVQFWEDNVLMDRILSCGVMKSEVLDLGCGSGEIDIVLAKHGFTVTGIDISPVAVALAGEHRERHPDMKSRLTFLVHDIEAGPLPKRFKSTLFSHTLERVIDPDATMKNIIGSLVPGSAVYVSVPLKKAWRDRTHLRHFTAKSLTKLLSKYSTEMEVIEDRAEKMLFATIRI